MDYEKMYKDALSYAKQAYGTGAYDDSTLEAIFPELAESEDERIINAIISFLRLTSFYSCNGCKKPEMIAWLEKQKEQKPTEKQDYSGLNDFERAIHRVFLSTGVENVPVTIIKETAKECLAQMKPVEWGEEDEMKREGIIQWLREYQKKFNPKDDSLSIESINSLIDWIKSLPLSRPKSSDNWKPNEDEERLINISISFLKDFADKGYENAVECIDWLKSKLNGNSCK